MSRRFLGNPFKPGPPRRGGPGCVTGCVFGAALVLLALLALTLAATLAPLL